MSDCRPSLLPVAGSLLVLLPPSLLMVLLLPLAVLLLMLLITLLEALPPWPAAVLAIAVGTAAALLGVLLLPPLLPLGLPPCLLKPLPAEYTAAHM